LRPASNNKMKMFNSFYYLLARLSKKNVALRYAELFLPFGFFSIQHYLSKDELAIIHLISLNELLHVRPMLRIQRLVWCHAMSHDEDKHTFAWADFLLCIQFSRCSS